MDDGFHLVAPFAREDDARYLGSRYEVEGISGFHATRLHAVGSKKRRSKRFRSRPPFSPLAPARLVGTLTAREHNQAIRQQMRHIHSYAVVERAEHGAADDHRRESAYHEARIPMQERKSPINSSTVAEMSSGGLRRCWMKSLSSRRLLG